MTNYAIKTGSNESRANTRNAIRAQQPFKTSGAMVGERAGSWYWGRLSQAEHDEMRRVERQILYVVYSYATPIAWCYRAVKNPDTGAVRLPESGEPANHNQWHVVDQKFSVTTTSHQSAVRSALGGYFVGVSGNGAAIEYETL